MENTILDQEITSNKEVRYAGFWDRVWASLIDVLVMIPVMIIGGINAVSWKNMILAMFLGIVYVVYKVYFEGTRGATIGKKALGIKVVNADMQVIDMNKSLTRNCLYILDAILSVISSYLIFSNPDFQNIDGWLEYGRFQNTNGIMLDGLVSLIIIVSVLFVAFNKTKQALHDKIANTFCIKEN